MKALLLVAVLALALAPLPAAEAHHTGCTPDYPCDPLPPCDAKCWLTHLTQMAKCYVDASYC